MVYRVYAKKPLLSASKNELLPNKDVFMKYRDREYLKTLTRNNRTVQQNVENGIKAWLTRQKRLVEKAIQKGIDISAIIQEYRQATELYDNDYSIPGILSKELGYIRPEGFYRFGDRNCVTPEIRKNYFRSDGRHIDDLAEELSNRYNREINPCNITQFIIDYPGREYEPLARVEETKQLFRELIGFNLTSSFIQNFTNSPEPTTSNCPF